MSKGSKKKWANIRSKPKIVNRQVSNEFIPALSDVSSIFSTGININLQINRHYLNYND